MRPPLFAPSTTPIVVRPSPLQRFIEQAQLALVYAPGRR